MSGLNPSEEIYTRADYLATYSDLAIYEGNYYDFSFVHNTTDTKGSSSGAFDVVVATGTSELLIKFVPPTWGRTYVCAAAFKQKGTWVTQESLLMNYIDGNNWYRVFMSHPSSATPPTISNVIFEKCVGGARTSVITINNAITHSANWHDVKVDMANNIFSISYSLDGKSNSDPSKTWSKLIGPTTISSTPLTNPGSYGYFISGNTLGALHTFSFDDLYVKVTGV